MASHSTLSKTATPNGVSFGIVVWLFLSPGLFIHLLIVCLSLSLPSSYLLACLTPTYLCVYFFDFLDPLAHYEFSVVISVINQNLGLNSPYSVSQTRITEQCWYPRHCVAIQRAGLCWTWKGWDFLERPRNISMEIPTHRGIRDHSFFWDPQKSQAGALPALGENR